MSFTPEQVRELEAPLVKSHVKKNPRGYDYVEAWHAIAEANRIFGHDGWTRETVLLQETNRDLVELRGERGPYQQWRVGYLAKVRITAGGVVREGTGFGSGMAKPEALGDAIESATKEAESDAMKRALMTFGNPFGLALYDKDKANVADAPPPPPPAPPEESGVYIACKAAIDLATDRVELEQWAKDNEASMAKIKADAPAVYEAVLTYWKGRVRALAKPKSADEFGMSAPDAPRLVA